MGDLTIERSWQGLRGIACTFTARTRSCRSHRQNLPAAASSQVTCVFDGQPGTSVLPWRTPDANVAAAIEVQSVAESQYHGLVLQIGR
jgi:hypothetical protein